MGKAGWYQDNAKDNKALTVCIIHWTYWSIPWIVIICHYSCMHYCCIFIWYTYNVIYWCNKRFVMICLLSSNSQHSVPSVILLFKNPRTFHCMMTSSNGSIFRVTGHLCGEFTGPGEFPTQRPVTRSFDVFFDLRLNKRLSKQLWGWLFETLSRPLWRHRNGLRVKCHTCQGYPGYFGEPEWISMQLPEISRVTW